VLLVIFILELTVLGLAVPGYLTLSGVLETSRTFVGPGLMALGMTFVIISGGIDLSVASLFALVSVAVGLGFRNGLPLGWAMLLGVIVGVVGGLINGALVAVLELHPFVVTLATMALFRGAAYAVSNAEAVSSFPIWFTNIGQFYFGGEVPAQLPIFVVAVIATWLTLNRTRFGRYVYGVGANETAVRFSGVSAARTKLGVYVLMGFLASLAAIIETSRLSTARANAGMGLELPVIAMVVLGGTSITGGSGTIGGTVLGILILSYLQDGLEFAGVRNDWSLIVVGGFLILGVFINGLFRSSAK
jgi:ribose/xylose/arabinose/galactoside ABC-type transport system permease subunit